MKKFLPFILAMAMVLSTVSGCGGKKAEVEKEDTSSSGNVPAYLNETGFPIVKEPITIKVMGSKGATHGEWKDMALFTKMEKITGIHLELDTPISTAYTEKKNLALASGDVPDVFLAGGITVKDEETYGPQGMFLALENYVDKYAPNVKKAFEDYPEAKKNATATDGHIYALPRITETKTQASAILYMNMNWLDKVGMKKPATADEFYNVLKAFKEKDPNGNGKQDEIPLSYFKVAPSSNILYTIFVAAFSGQAGGVNFDVKDGKVIYNPMEPTYKEFLTYMNKLYAEGLIDKEIFSQTQQQMAAKYKEGKLGISTTSLSVVLNPGDKDTYELLPPLIASNNTRTVTPKIDSSATGSFAITNKCKYPEAMMRWIDVLYRDVENAVDGVCGLMNFLGEYDVDWKYSEDKKTYSRISKIEGMTPVEYQNKHIAPQGFGKVVISAVPDNDPFLLLKAVESDKQYHPYMIERFPAVRYPVEQQEKLTLLENDINTYVEQMTAKFIVGEEPLSKWDEYISKLKKDLRIEEAIKIRQDAYDARKSSK